MMDKSLSQLNARIENISLSRSPQLNSTLRHKSPGNRSVHISPSRGKTPCGIKRKPMINKSKSPIGGGDRFIPDRNGMNFELSHYLVNNPNIAQNQNNKPTPISEMVGNISKYRILCYQNKPPPQPEGYSNNLKVIYSASRCPSTTKKSSRYIPDQPERILDAPDIRNDYYLQLLDWSSNNILAVALNNEVYLWNAENGDITPLLSVEDDYISSLSWVASGKHLAVGVSDGRVQIWDVQKPARLRYLSNSEFRISCLSWNSHILSAGSKDGNIYNHDVRVASSLLGTFRGHSQEICGLKWSPNGRLLASGGNDNTINLWSDSLTASQSNTSQSAVFTFTEHQAAVKALAWCPWRPNCLASGGGTVDRMIRVWNTQNGQNLYSIDTKSQVSAILWSKEYRELISSHGYVNNELILWKYPDFTKVAELTGHSARILGMAMSADETTVVSLGADETLRFWQCFQVDEEKVKHRKKIESKHNECNTLNNIKLIR